MTRMLRTRWHRAVGGAGGAVAVGARVPLLEAARDPVGVPAAMAVAMAPAPEDPAKQGEEEEQAEDREQKAEREEAEAPAVVVAVVRDGGRDRRCGPAGGDDDLGGALRESGVVGAEGDGSADEQDEDRGECSSHDESPLWCSLPEASRRAVNWM